METRFLSAVIGWIRARNRTMTLSPIRLSRSTRSELLLLAMEGGRARQIRADGSVENSSTR